MDGVCGRKDSDRTCIFASETVSQRFGGLFGALAANIAARFVLCHVYIGLCPAFYTHFDEHATLLARGDVLFLGARACQGCSLCIFEVYSVSFHKAPRCHFAAPEAEAVNHVVTQ